MNRNGFWNLGAGVLLATVALAGHVAAQSGTWRAETVNGAEALGIAGMRFGDGGYLSGATGCNRFNGKAIIADGTLILDGPLATTRMACPGDALATQEDIYLKILGETPTISFDPVSGVMTLSGTGSSITFSAGPFDEDARASAKGGTLFDTDYVNVHGVSDPLNIREAPTTDARVVTRVLAGTLLRNEGCESHEDRDWCKVAFLGASDITGFAAAEFLQPAPALVRARDGVFDRIGTVPCAMPTDSQALDCDVGLAFDGDHSIAMVIYRPDGRTTLLGFIDGLLSTAIDDGKPIESVESTAGETAIQVVAGGGQYDIPRALLAKQAE